MAIKRFLFATDKGLYLWDEGITSKYVCDEEETDKRIEQEIKKIIFDCRNKNMPNTMILKRAIEDVTKEKFMTYSNKLPGYNVRDTSYYGRFYEVLYQPMLFNEEIKRMQDERNAQTKDAYRWYLHDTVNEYKNRKTKKVRKH